MPVGSSAHSPGPELPIGLGPSLDFPRGGWLPAESSCLKALKLGPVKKRRWLSVVGPTHLVKGPLSLLRRIKGPSTEYGRSKCSQGRPQTGRRGQPLTKSSWGALCSSLPGEIKPVCWECFPAYFAACSHSSPSSDGYKSEGLCLVFFIPCDVCPARLCRAAKFNPTETFFLRNSS